MFPAPELKDVVYDPNLPVIDREQFEMLVMPDEGDEGLELIRDIFGIFTREGDDKLEQLDAVCAANDLTELRKLVHFIAGSAGNLGLSRLCAFYRAIEHAIDNEQVRDVSGFADAVRSEYALACEAYKAELLS
ncbi:Hpt domain-containing protein [Coraliomargarita akajimensis]|uniref:Hpt protein n=1 Tax=Coraliomargarita akajimensis (strain DSM 45221 / IAM 15411 / JCM 23193 / KCTC 12865 / 04OKA010-24) TaxID=583355 RepID=D5ELU3_CORAD|nr:Hpt domain-containing protein [Coraliomargarita akajimensis]ADE53268.1 Hpt protein [Coraliomargarita akajimensis DSM 45221]